MEPGYRETFEGGASNQHSALQTNMAHKHKVIWRVFRLFCWFLWFNHQQSWKWLVNLKNENNITNEDNFKNEDNLKKEDDLKNGDNLINEDDLRNEATSNIRKTSKLLVMVILHTITIQLQ